MLLKNKILKCILLTIAIIVPIMLFPVFSFAQERLETPVKMKIEDGNFDEVTVVLTNKTTNESNTIPGSSKFDLELKLNCEYIISFKKPGYITKKIAFNTNVPPARMAHGFYPFTFEVNLFQQYDGVNIVVFNQPVGKISYSRLIDDFDYDTDYTKQIQSQLKAAEEEILKKQKEAKKLAEQKLVEEEQRKKEEEALARLQEKEKKEAEKRAAEEAKLLAAEEAKLKKAEEEKRKQQQIAIEEEENRRKAIAKIEEEERARLKATEEEERRKTLSAQSGNESRTSSLQSGSGIESNSAIQASQGNEDRQSSIAGGIQGDDRSSSASMGSGDDSRRNSEAESVLQKDNGIVKAESHMGSEARNDVIISESAKKSQKGSVNSDISNHNENLQQFAEAIEYEKLPDISVEEIQETNRSITKVTVRKGNNETVFSKVVYDWGGVFYFRSMLSISQSLYKLKTGMD